MFDCSPEGVVSVAAWVFEGLALVDHNNVGTLVGWVNLLYRQREMHKIEYWILDAVFANDWLA